LRYEFVFTNLIPGNTRHFTSFIGVFKYTRKNISLFLIHLNQHLKYFRAYNSSRLYRELKLRGAIIKNDRLRLLMFETMYSIANGVWNLSSEQVIFYKFNQFFFKKMYYES
jgi:Bardet-Biedl syndrome 5 protein